MPSARADLVPAKAVQLATGQDHACFIDASNAYFCFGNGHWIGRSNAMTACGSEDDEFCGDLSTAPVRVVFPD